MVRWVLLLLAGVCCLGTDAAAQQTSSTSPQRPVATPPQAGDRASPPVRELPRPIPGRFIITLQERADPRAVAAEHGASPDFIYTRVLNGFSGSISDAARAGLLRDYRVVRVEADQEVIAHQVPWSLDRIDQRALPLDGRHLRSNSGRGVTVYVLDTGIRFDHEEFGGRAVNGIDVIRDGMNGTDCNGHGTHVAGLVGGSRYGAAPEATLVSARVLGCDGRGSMSGVIAALDWIAANGRRPGVASLSLGGPASSSTDDAVRRLVSLGFPVVVAAGNDGKDACTASPARVREAVTVAASDANDARPAWSNFGACVDLFAPGVAVPSAWHTTPTAIAHLSGTSMATPLVSGFAALLLEQNPQATGGIGDLIVLAGTRHAVTNSQSAQNHLLYSHARLTMAQDAGVTTIRTDLTTVHMPAYVNNITYEGSERFTAIGNEQRNVFRGGPEGDYLIGFGGNDVFFGASGAPNTFQGGPGDDLYLVEAGDSITEFPNEGLDQVQTWLPYYELRDNSEELIRTGPLAFTGIGNNGPNRIVGGPAADYLLAKGGDDVLTGGGDRDMFGFPGNDGSDRITDFNAGAAGVSVDRIDLRGRRLGFGDLKIERSTQNGVVGVTILLPGGDRIFLDSVDPSLLGAEDFVF